MKRMMTFFILCAVFSGCAKMAVLTEGVFQLQNVSITSPEGERVTLTDKQLHNHYIVEGHFGGKPGSMDVNFQFSEEFLGASDGFFDEVMDLSMSVDFDLFPEEGEARAKVRSLSFYRAGEPEDVWVSATDEEVESIEVSLRDVPFNDSLFKKEDRWYQDEMDNPEEIYKGAVFFSFTVEGYLIEGEFHTKSYKGLTKIGGYHL